MCVGVVIEKCLRAMFNGLTCVHIYVGINYPEHVLTWEGYGNWHVRSCVCV